MQFNNVQSFINQQMGLSLWNHCDIPIKRLRCTKDNSYSQLLPQANQEDLYRDTPIFTSKFCPHENNGHLLALANEDGKLAIHNSLNTQKHGIQAHNNAIFDLSWMFGQMKLITASGDHTSKMYDIGDGEIRLDRVFCGHSRSVKTTAFTKDNSSIFASGGRDGNIILWDTRTNTRNVVGKADGVISNSHMSKVFTPSKSKKKFNTPTNSGVKSVTGLVFQENHTLISCGAGDGIIKIWDLRKHYSNFKREALPKQTISYPGNTTKNGYSSLIIDDNGIKLYANCLDSSIYCYNVGTYNYEPVMMYTGHQNSTYYVKSTLSKDGKYLISGSSDENAYIWDTKYSEPLVKLTGHTAEVTCVAWCSSQLILVTCSDDMTYKIWTSGSEELLDWEVNGRGIAEVLPKRNRIPPIKRVASLNLDFTPKKIFTECQKCSNATSSKFCENCVRNNSKRKNTSELENHNKMIQTEFGPRRLFGNMNNPAYSDKTDVLANYLEPEENPMNIEEYHPPKKLPRLTETEEIISTNIPDVHLSSNSDCDDEPPMKLAKLQITPTRYKRPNISSPTKNLPNYVIDGIAPHLSYSPPKKKCQDWLTRIRVEKLLRKEYEKTELVTTPKQPKPEHLPRKKSTTPRSPILRYFKVTNSPHKCDATCSKQTNCIDV